MAEGLQRDIFNQCALRRLDPNLREVVGFSAFVAIYKFSPGENQWKKTDVEGTLFVYARSGAPSHHILVLNRLNPINFVEPICGDLILQRREPFLFYVTSKCSLYGIWFYDSGDCLRLSYLIEGIKRQLMSTPVTDEDWSDIAAFKSLMGMSDTPGRVTSRVKKSGNSNGKKSARTKKPERGKRRIAAQLSLEGNGDPVAPARTKKSEDEEEEGAVAVGVAGDITDEDEDQTPKSVVDFFARAGSAPINTQVGLMPGMTHMYGDDSEGAAMNPIVHQIVTNPYHSLEHVEKQQMMASTHQPKPASSHQPKPASSQQPKPASSQQPKAASSQQPKAASTQQPKAASTQQPKAASTQKPKTTRTQKTKATGAQKPKTTANQEPKEDDAQKPKEGEAKTPKADAPASLVEFLTKLKISRSANPDPQGRIEEIPDLLPLIPEPPLPNLASLPRIHPIPFMPEHITPMETFHFIPGPMEAFGFIPDSSRPLSSFPKPDFGFMNPVFPKPSEPMPEPPAPLPPTPEPPAPLSQTPEPPAPFPQTPEPSIQLSQTPEPPPPLSQTPEPPPPLPPTPEPTLPLSPTPDPPIPLSSILRQARRSLPPKPALPKPLSLLPKPPEPSLSSMPPPVFSPESSNIGDFNTKASSASASNKDDDGGGGGNFIFEDSDQDGEGATAAPNPPVHTEGHDFNVEALTRDQLLQAICHLLQNDPAFVKQIHEAYLKTLTEKFT